jgi:hypothetical protein
MALAIPRALDQHELVLLLKGLELGLKSNESRRWAVI